MTASERSFDIVIIVFSSLIILYFAAHQMLLTGFFTATFGTLEILMLYGSLIFWIITATLEGLLDRRNLSRLTDLFGGLIFVIVSISWLFVVFPFEFAYFANVLPDFLRFLVQWISNDIARVLMVIGIILHLVMEVYSAILRLVVRKERSRRKKVKRNKK